MVIIHWCLNSPKYCSSFCAPVEIVGDIFPAFGSNHGLHRRVLSPTSKNDIYRHRSFEIQSLPELSQDAPTARKRRSQATLLSASAVAARKPATATVAVNARTGRPTKPRAAPTTPCALGLRGSQAAPPTCFKT